MKNLRALRKSKGLSMKQLGEIFNVGESTISMWENDNREPDIKTIIKLSSYFDVTIDYLLGKTEPQTAKKEISLEEFLTSNNITSFEMFEYFQKTLELAKKVEHNKNLGQELANEFISKN